MRRLLLAALVVAIAPMALLRFVGRGEAIQPAGFRTLAGADARAYTTPSDLRLIRSFRIDSYTYERYQQRAANADVLGGQTTVLRAADGTPAYVIGARYPGLAPSNAHLIGRAKPRPSPHRTTDARPTGNS